MEVAYVEVLVPTLAALVGRLSAYIQAASQSPPLLLVHVRNLAYDPDENIVGHDR